jgi:hypothetical protein
MIANEVTVALIRERLSKDTRSHNPEVVSLSAQLSCGTCRAVGRLRALSEIARLNARPVLV